LLCVVMCVCIPDYLQCANDPRTRRRKTPSRVENESQKVTVRRGAANSGLTVVQRQSLSTQLNR
jgi:hypothetical protein